MLVVPVATYSNADRETRRVSILAHRPTIRFDGERLWRATASDFHARGQPQHATGCEPSTEQSALLLDSRC